MLSLKAKEFVSTPKTNIASDVAVKSILKKLAGFGGKISINITSLIGKFK